jgi:hypothetical protein
MPMAPGVDAVRLRENGMPVTTSNDPAIAPPLRTRSQGRTSREHFHAGKVSAAHVSSNCAGNCPVLKMIVGSSS